MTKKQLLKRLDDGDQIHVCVDLTRTERHYKGEPWIAPGSPARASIVCLVGGYVHDERVNPNEVQQLIKDGLVVKHPSSADVPMAIGTGSCGLCLVGKKWAKQKAAKWPEMARALKAAEQEGLA